MGSTLLQESWAVEVGSREPWAEDSKLYQPIEETQALCHDKTQSIAVQVDPSTSYFNVGGGMICSGNIKKTIVQIHLPCLKFPRESLPEYLPD